MQTAIDQFRTNISRVRNLGAISEALDSQTPPSLDLSDVLRAELVLAVSALDHFIHELVRLGMLEAYRGNRPRTRRFLRFEVSLENALTGITDNTGEQWIDSEIRTRNGYRSFQDPGRISEAIRLISDIPLWESVSQRMGNAPTEVKEDLRRIIDRRNQIVHEADMIPPPYEGRWSIDRMMVSNAVDMVEKIAEAIYDAVALPVRRFCVRSSPSEQKSELWFCKEDEDGQDLLIEQLGYWDSSDRWHSNYSEEELLSRWQIPPSTLKSAIGVFREKKSDLYFFRVFPPPV